MNEVPHPIVKSLLKAAPKWRGVVCGVQILTIAGWAWVSAYDNDIHVGYVSLRVRFEVPTLARIMLAHDITLNPHSGKWNHYLKAATALEDAHMLFRPLLSPLVSNLGLRDTTAIAEAEFWGAIGDMVNLSRREDYEATINDLGKKRLPTIGSCGHSSVHAYCGGCGTDYMGQAEREFFQAAAPFIVAQQIT